MNRAIFLVGLLCVSLLSTEAQAQDTFTVGNTTLFATDLVDDSQIPWELVWGGDDMLWCSERKGRVIRIDPSSGDYTTVLDLNVTYNGSGAPAASRRGKDTDYRVRCGPCILGSVGWINASGAGLQKQAQRMSERPMLRWQDHGQIKCQGN